MFRVFVLRWPNWQRSKPFFMGLICTALVMFLQGQVPFIASAQDTSPSAAPQSEERFSEAGQLPEEQPSEEQLPEEQLPEPRAHTLPPSLAQWQGSESQGDYFSAIEPTPVGYLVWSEFPIQVFIEPSHPTDNAYESARSQDWVEAVAEAIQEWSLYLPLEEVSSSEIADITIWRSAPPIQLDNRSDDDRPNSGAPNSPSGNRLPRIRSAETKYHLFVDHPVGAAAKLSQRFTIQLTPNQTNDYIKATARHEIGHALGIWGHSPIETDALYFSQVRNSPPISQRDINTLKRIYQQPTRLGWELVRIAN